MGLPQRTAKAARCSVGLSVILLKSSNRLFVMQACMEEAPIISLTSEFVSWYKNAGRLRRARRCLF